MLSAERGASGNTLDAYSRDLVDLAVFLSARKRGMLTAQPEHLRDYLRELHDAGLAASTAARRLSSMKQFYLFLFSEGTRTDDSDVSQAPDSSHKSVALSPSDAALSAQSGFSVS